MDIHILSPEVIDQIAAGEVVERPAHLIKELVENALDAEASEIEVQIDQGGRQVKIKDNGKGMSREDLPLAVARHATSKISKSSDIWTLGSYGFRGEALASIGAVSRMTIISKQPNGDGYQLVSEFGTSRETESVGSEDGTTVIIEDLFSNVPARLKFLKSDSAEITQIKNVLKAMALSYPQVTFRVRSQGKLLFMWAATENPLERSQQILEIDKMYFGNAAVNGVKASVCVAAPNVTTGNSRQIWIFAQQRWIQDRGLQAAVMDGFRSLLMHGEFPYAVIQVECLPENIDVNIHPTKSQVKFLNQSDAFRAVNRAVKGVLDEGPWVKNDIVTTSEVPAVSPVHNPENLKFMGETFESTQYAKKDFQYPEGASQTTLSVLEAFAASPKKKYKDDNELDRHLNSGEVESETIINDSTPQNLLKQKKWASLQVLGQADNTYIITQNDHSLVLVDQHAAHERVAYETLMEQWLGGNIEIQNYLVPLVVEFDEENINALTSQISGVEKLGVFLEQMGPTSIAVNGAPSLLKEVAIVEALKVLSEEILECGGSFALEKVISHVCATLACHSVVRAGQTLSIEQMRSLLDQMDEFSHSSFCPHGRPVYVEYPFAKVERDFGRIV